MSVGSIVSRTTSQLGSNQLLRSLQQTNTELFKAQEQITTGKNFALPSDSPADVSAILTLQSQIRAREQYENNLRSAQGVLNNIDGALGDATEIVREAHGVALSQIGVGSDAATRETQAVIVDSQIQALLSITNRQYQDISLFGGNNGASGGSGVFEEFLGGIRYLGGDQQLLTDVGGSFQPRFTSDGLSAFGALSTRVKSNVDLDPQASASTKLADLTGAEGEGIRLGNLSLRVNGGTPVVVDLSTAETLGDVETRINAALGGAGSIAIVAEGLQLTTNVGFDVQIQEIGSGKTATDLGIVFNQLGGTVVNGPSLGVKLNPLTELADLATPIDWASGLVITQGETTKNADFTGATTIQDVINVFEDLDLGLHASINEAGDGIDVISQVSGLKLSIGEAGGTTATDLGLRTLMANTSLDDFRQGLGVETIVGENDIEITLSDGQQFEVDMTGATTAGEVIDRITAAATAAGVGGLIDVGFTSFGNGFEIEDLAGGPDDMTIRDINTSQAALHLGIRGVADKTPVFTSEESTQAFVDNGFTSMINLRNSLIQNDELGITLAGGKLETDIDNLGQARAVVGVDTRRIEETLERSIDLGITEQSLLADIEEADLTEVITRFTQLQTQLQASLSVGAQNLQLSLLDFLR